MSQPVQEVDYFTDLSVLKDPYEYFESFRASGPVHEMKTQDYVVVTGFQEAIDILQNTDDFSSFMTAAPNLPLPFEPEGDDITEQIEAYRKKDSPLELLATYDGERHTAARSLLTALFTPSRLKANEEYMNGIADNMIREVVAKGQCELISEIATPYVTLVVADLLGVPADDRQKFMEVIAAGAPAGNMDKDDERNQSSPLEFMGGYFFGYVEDRRANPREDVLTELSMATYPDGTMPDVLEVVKSAMFLFAAGQDTSAKLLGNSVRFLTENMDYQQKLRQDPSQIPAFLEECLRLEGSVKATFRLAKKKTRIGDVEIPAGKRVVVALSAANRDPKRWDHPNEFRMKRDKIMQHLSFGRGPHTCIGGPLARAEVRVILERLFEQTSEFTLSEEHHGPAGHRDFSYEASFIIRGLDNLYVNLKT